MNISNLIQENEDRSSAGSPSPQPRCSSSSDPPQNVNYLAHVMSNLNVSKTPPSSLNQRLKITRDTPPPSKLFESSVQFQDVNRTCNTNTQFLDREINNLKFAVEELVDDIEAVKTSSILRITKLDETLSRLVIEITEKNHKLVKSICVVNNIQGQFSSKLNAIEISIGSHAVECIRSRECVFNRILELEKWLKVIESKFCEDFMNDLRNRLVNFEKLVRTQRDSNNLCQERLEKGVQILNSKISDLQNQNQCLLKELELRILYEKSVRAYIEQQEELENKEEAMMSKLEELVEQLLTRMESMETCLLYHVSEEEKRDKLRDTILSGYEAVIADVCGSLDDRVTDLSRDMDVVMKQDSKDESMDKKLEAIHEKVDELCDEEVARSENFDNIFIMSPCSSGESDISQNRTQVNGETIIEIDSSEEPLPVNSNDSDSFVSLQSHGSVVESSGLSDDTTSDYISIEQNEHAGVSFDSSSELDNVDDLMDMISFSGDETESKTLNVEL